MHCETRPVQICLLVIKLDKTGNVSDLLDKLIVHLECPQLQASRQLSDGGEGEKELLGAAQGNIRVDQLSLLDPLLLLLCGDHCQDFLGKGGNMRRREGKRGGLLDHPSSQHIKTFSVPDLNFFFT